VVDWVVELGGFVFETGVVVGEDGLEVFVTRFVFTPCWAGGGVDSFDGVR
jgi:hypothetical protein